MQRVEHALTRIESDLSNRNVWVATALSLMVPGLGQVYNGKIIKGGIIFLTSFLVIPYLYGIYDAYRDAGGEMPRAPKLLTESLEVRLTREAARRGGEISVTEGVVATGRSFGDIEACLDDMCKRGYVEIGNRSDSGVVVYRFGQLHV